MALFVCNCLNVTLESDEIEENIDIENLELTTTEQRDIFFSEKLLACPVNFLKTLVAQPALVSQRTIGRWILHSCLACGLTTHAILSGITIKPNVALIPKAIWTTLDQVNSLKKSSNFSSVFNLLVPEMANDIEMKENIDTNNVIVSDKKPWAPTQQVIGSLNKQLNQSLQSQLEAIEDSVRQFRDQQYAEFEAYKEKAQRDHKILASIISKARSNGDNDGWRHDASLDNGPPSPQLPPLQRRRLSSFKDAKKLSHNMTPSRNYPPEEDSLDAEDLFDLEGMDSRHMISDQEYYDSDQDSNDSAGAGVGAGAGRGARARDSAGEVARSLPINMPNFPIERPTHNDLDDDEEPQDIAASIKALARSVHGDAFELPRPRFSTQI